MLSKFGTVAATVLALAALTATTVGAAGNKCQAAKVKLAGKKAVCRLGLDGNQATKGVAKDATKDMACKTKFSDGFTKLEGKGGCLTTGDAAAVEAKVDALETDINTALSPGAPPAKSKCQGAKIKAAAKKAACLLAVRSAMFSKGLPADDLAKVMKCESSFNTAFSKADAGADCTTHNDATAIEGMVVSSVNDTGLALNGCGPLVTGQPIANTYKVSDVLGPKICLFNSTANQLQPCTGDADCGGDAGACVQTPWISAGGVNLPFPLGIDATYTVATPDPSLRCSQPVCIACGNANATCAGMTGCATAGNCISTAPTCCDQPGFKVPTFFINGLNVCVKVDQTQCGVGVVNNSNPQTGDNEVSKVGDTTDPGPDCMYGTADDPATTPCNATGEGADKKGKIVRTLGNGAADSSGVHSRFAISIMATAWQSTATACTPTSTFDPGNILLTQLILNAELSTAGATGELKDLSGDGCKAAGVGFGGSAATKFGPVALGAPALTPAPYGGGSNMMGSVGLVFPGSAPLYDIGFIAFVPFGAPTVVTSQSCSCSPTPGCPE